MAQGIEASLEAGPGDATTRPSVSSWVARNWMWLGVGGVAVVAGGFLLHQLMAWPPHEDETLALFVGRDSLPGVVEHVTRDRGGAPLHFLLAWTVAHLGFGLGGLRILSAAFALGSLPLVAALGRRLGGPLVGLVAAAIVAPSWLFLFHGVYGRMYSLFLFLSLACTLALLRALESGGRGPLGGLGRRIADDGGGAPVRDPPACRAGGVRAARRTRPNPGGNRRRRRRPRPRHSVLAHRPRPRGTVRRRRRRRGREAGRARGRRAVPVALGGRCDRRLVAGDARRRPHGRRGRRAPPPHGAHPRPVPRRHDRRRVPRREARRVGGPGVAAPDLPRAAARDRGRVDDRPDRAALRGDRRGAGGGARGRAGRVGLAADSTSLRVGAGRTPGGPGRGRGVARPHEPLRRRALRLRAALPRRLGDRPSELPDDHRPARRRPPGAPGDRARRPARARRLGARRERAEQRQARGSRSSSGFPTRPSRSRHVPSARSSCCGRASRS